MFCASSAGSIFSSIGGGCVRVAVLRGLPRPRLTGVGGAAAGGEGARTGGAGVLRGRPRPRLAGVAIGEAARDGGDGARLPGGEKC